MRHFRGPGLALPGVSYGIMRGIRGIRRSPRVRLARAQIVQMSITSMKDDDEEYCSFQTTEQAALCFSPSLSLPTLQTRGKRDYRVSHSYRCNHSVHPHNSVFFLYISSCAIYRLSPQLSYLLIDLIRADIGRFFSS